MTLRGHSDSVNGVCFLPCSNSFVSCSADKSISLWDIRAVSSFNVCHCWSSYQILLVLRDFVLTLSMAIVMPSTLYRLLTRYAITTTPAWTLPHF